MARRCRIQVNRVSKVGISHLIEFFNSATIAQDYDKFWVGETSNIVKVVERDAAIPSGISTTRRPIETTTPSFSRSTSTSQRTEDRIYEGCGDTKTCFGSPDNCVATKSCQTFSAVIVRGDRYIVELRSQKNAGYVALGLSDDDKMGRDSVVECVSQSGSVKAYTSMTVAGAGKYDSPRTGIVSQFITHPKSLILKRFHSSSLSVPKFCKID